jgi:hypothetical protein
MAMRSPSLEVGLTETWTHLDEEDISSARSLDWVLEFPQWTNAHSLRWGYPCFAVPGIRQSSMQ